jgi:hypothetical protein
MRLTWGWLLAACTLATSAPACTRGEPVRTAAPSQGYQRPRPQPPPPAPPMSLLPGAPLPTGWIWPFDLGHAAAFFTPPANVRPLDVSRLLAYQGSGPCSPAEVAPGIWFAPDCGRQRVAGSPNVPVKSFGMSLSELPPSVDLRATGLDGPIKYQQMVGVCWSFALSTVMDNALRRAGHQEIIAPLHVLSSGVWDDLWAKGKSDRDLTLEPRWPYDPVKACKLNEAKSEIWCEQAYHVPHGSWRSDPALVAEVEQANRTGVFHITKVEQLKPNDPDQIAATLAQGQAVYVSFEYNSTAWGKIGNSDPVIPDYTQEEGGHAVVAVGYRGIGPARQFLLHNSWSNEWRDGGYAWISDAMVRAHAKDAFTVEVHVDWTGGTTPPPATTGTATGWPFPVPIPGLPGGGGGSTASDCGAGMARDVILGTCAKVCPGGSPPVG